MVIYDSSDLPTPKPGLHARDAGKGLGEPGREKATEGQLSNQINATNTNNKGSGRPGYFHSTY